VPSSETPTHLVEPLEDFLRQAAKVEMEEIEKLGRKHKVATRMVIRLGHPVEEIIAERRKRRRISLSWVPMVEAPFRQPSWGASRSALFIGILRCLFLW